MTQLRMMLLMLLLLCSGAFSAGEAVPASDSGAEKTEKPERTAVPLESLLGKDCGNLSALKRETFLKPAASRPFSRVLTWTSALKTEAVYPGLNGAPRLTFLGQDVARMKMEFRNGKLTGVFVLFAIPEKDVPPGNAEKFTAFWNRLSGSFAAFAGAECFARKEIFTCGAEVVRVVSVRTGFSFELRTCFSGAADSPAGRFAEAEIRPVDPKTGAEETDLRLNSVFASPQKNEEVFLVKDGRKNVYLGNVPMLAASQGISGTAVVLDQMCRAAGNGGVSLEAIAEYLAGSILSGVLDWNAVKLAGSKFDLRLTDVYDRGRDVRNFEKLMSRYNRAAQKLRVPKLEPVYIVTGRDWDPERRVYREQFKLDEQKTAERMRPNILRCMWTLEKNDFKRFQKTVQTCVNRGEPVGWCVSVPEIRQEEKNGHAAGKTDSSAPGGAEWPGTGPASGVPVRIVPGGDRMPEPLSTAVETRLIIGFNTSTDSILYLDPLEPDRIKTLPADLAWGITRLYFIVKGKK